MRTLVVAATVLEVGRLLSRLGLEPPDSTSGARLVSHLDQPIDVLVTGVGMVPAAAWCARVLSSGRYDRAVQLGLCGSFDPALPPGSVVHVVTDCLPEVGAEDGDEFLSLADMGLADDRTPPFEAGWLTTPHPPFSPVVAALPTVRGITVNTVHGRDRTIEAVTGRFAPQVETMEGAAFMYACLTHDVPFAQIRAVSNRVERRNRAAWQIEAALVRLTDTVAALFER